MVIGIAIASTADKTATCNFFKTFFRDTAPVVTDTGKDPFLFMSGLLEHHHLIVAGWALNLDEGLGVVSYWNPADGHGCTD